VLEDEILRCAQNDKGGAWSCTGSSLQIDPTLMFLSLRRRLRPLPARGFSHRASTPGISCAHLVANAYTLESRECVKDGSDAGMASIRNVASFRLP
jgi:hypothetical protein